DDGRRTPAGTSPEATPRQLGGRSAVWMKVEEHTHSQMSPVPRQACAVQQCRFALRRQVSGFHASSLNTRPALDSLRLGRAVVAKGKRMGKADVSASSSVAWRLQQW